MLCSVFPRLDSRTFKRRHYIDVVLQAGQVNVHGWSALAVVPWDVFKQKTWETLQISEG
jgi:hypothetical protein